MENSENTKFKIYSIALVVVIIGIIAFVIVPNFSPKSPEKVVEKIDFSNPAWIEHYIEGSVEPYGKDFYVGTAFSYNIRSNKIVATFASQNTVDELRDHYLTLPGAVLSGRNDETSLNVTTQIKGQNLRVYNYYSSISRVVEMEITLDSGRAEQIISQLENAFPVVELANISGIEELTSGEIFGGYVRYQYGQFDGFTHPDVPIFSRAYFYVGSADDYESSINALNELYPEHKYDDTQQANYFRIDGQIISIVHFVTDFSESVVSVSIQEEPGQ